MPLLHIESLPDDLVAPVLVVAFDGWVDAAGASSAATEHLAAGGTVVATFDDDTLFDYRSRRPCLESSSPDARVGDTARLQTPNRPKARTPSRS